MRTRVHLPAVLAAVVLAVTGCGSNSGSDSADVADASPATASSSGGTKVPETLNFTATTLDEKPFDASSLRGKPAVLWFWAPWCPTCKGQAAETSKVAADFEGKANVVGVAGLDTPAAMRDFVSDTGTGSFPHLSDENGEVWKRFGVTEQSHYVILDEAGKAVYEGVLPGGEGLAAKVAALTG
ncbi:peroxiredoxin family protein [Streptomyces sp. NPDC003635]